jgi:hypothetical protein
MSSQSICDLGMLVGDNIDMDSFVSERNTDFLYTGPDKVNCNADKYCKNNIM